MNFKNLFDRNYNHGAIEGMLQGASTGVFASSIVAPLIIVYLLFDHVPLVLLSSLLLFQFLLYVVRVSHAKKVLKFIKTDINYAYSQLPLAFSFIAFTTLFYGIIIWYSVLNALPELLIFILATLTIALASASLSTLVVLFHTFLLFFLLMTLPLIAALFYYTGEMTTSLGVIALFHMLIYSVTGYKQSVAVKNSFFLKDTFETIFNETADAVLLIKGSRFKDCNNSMVNIFEHDSKESFLKSNIREFSPKLQPDGKNSVKKMLTMMAKARKEGKASFEWLHKKVSGEEFLVDITLTAITLEGEELLHADIRDITRKKELEEKLKNYTKDLEEQVKIEVEKNRIQDQQLQQQSRFAQMGEMISMIAHQWRQPLSAISVTASSLKINILMNDIDNSKFEKNVDLVLDYTQHLSRTIDDFRDFFKEDKALQSATFDEMVQSK
jgi:PAS domain S-box-containing protein